MITKKNKIGNKVDFSYPGDEEVSKGATVLRIKGNMSWVHTVVRQVGFVSTEER